VVVGLAARADNADLAAMITNLDVSEEAADRLKNIDADITTDEKMNGLDPNSAGENFQ